MTTKKGSGSPSENVSEASGFDFGKYNVIELAMDGVWMQPDGPDGIPLVQANGKPWRVLVAGQDSKYYEEAMTEIAKVKGKKQMAAGTDSLDYSDIKDGEVIIAAGVTLDWDPLIEKDIDPSGGLIKPIGVNNSKPTNTSDE